MSDDPLPLSTVGRYYCYQATSTVGFITPIFTLFLLFRDLSFAQIATLSAVNWLAVTLGEVPTGYLGDRMGRRDSLVASTVLMAASTLGFVVAESFPAFVVLYVLWGLGMTFTSGSESAWLYETLEANLDEDRFTRVRGRGTSIKRWVGALAMVGGSLLYVADPTAPFLAAAAWNLLGVPVLFAMPRNAGDDGDDEEDGPVTGLEALSLVRGALLEPPLRSFLAYVGLLFAAVGAANTYVQPITVDVLETHLQAATAVLPVPPEASLGLMYAAFTAVSAGASYYAGDVEGFVGRRRTLLAVVPLVGVALLVPVAVPLLAIPVFFLMRGAGTLSKPMVNAQLNEGIDSAGRATVLSAAQMAFGVVRLPLILAGGVVADAVGPLFAVAGFGAAVVAGSVGTWLLETPFADAAPAEEPAPAD